MEYREEPCRTALNRVKGMPFEWSLNPYTGCAHRCTFCYVRAFEARADRPSDDRYGRSIRVKVERRRRAAARARAAVVDARERRDRRRDRPLPAGRGALSPHPCLHPRARRGANAVLAHHARADDPARRRRARRRGPQRAKVHVSFSVPTLDERIWRDDRAGHGAAAAPPRDRAPPRRRGNRHGRRARADPARASPTTRSCSPRSSARRGRRARPGSGRTSSTSGPGTREHFLEALARDWPELLPEYERLYAGRVVPPVVARPSPSGGPSASSHARSWQPRRPTIEPEPEPEQLALAV